VFIRKQGKMRLQNNWLLRACMANIQEIEQHLPSIKAIISHKKDRHKMCGHLKFFQVPEILKII